MTKIEYGNYYHLFNKGTNGMKIFVQKTDFEYFLYLMKVYLLPVADIYTYALMSNHFHILVRIKEKTEIGFLNSEYAEVDELHLKWKTFFPRKNSEKEDKHFKKQPVPEKMLQHLFLTYAKRFNEKYKRSGSLFQHPYKRIHISEEKYLKNLILYIHKNPIHHNIRNSVEEYKYTSYHSILSNKATNMPRDFVLELFDDKENFIFLHKNKDEINNIDFLIAE